MLPVYGVSATKLDCFEVSGRVPGLCLWQSDVTLCETDYGYTYKIQTYSTTHTPNCHPQYSMGCHHNTHILESRHPQYTITLPEGCKTDSIARLEMSVIVADRETHSLHLINRQTGLVFSIKLEIEPWCVSCMGREIWVCVRSDRQVYKLNIGSNNEISDVRRVH